LSSASDTEKTPWYLVKWPQSLDPLNVSPLTIQGPDTQ